MTELKLIYLTKEYENMTLEYIKEFLLYNSEINGTGGLGRYDDYDEWLQKVENDLDIPNIPENRVPASTYFFIRTSDDKILGMINIRHKLNEFLQNEGGHIGYSIRPTERERGLSIENIKFVNVGGCAKQWVQNNVQKINIVYYRFIKDHVIIIGNRGGVYVENKTLELMGKMYQEMQHGFSELRHDIDGIKEDVAGMKVDLTGVKQDLTEVKQRVINIEIDHGKKLSALFDGYKQNSDKLDRIQEEVSKHEEIILRRVK